MPEINTEFLFTIALEIQVSSLGDTPYGSRRIFHFDGGSFEGPKLKGTVPPGGGSSLIRRDDVLEVDVRLILETDDKHQIYMAWKGLRHGPKEVMDRLYRGEIVDPRAYYLRLRKVRLDEPHLCDCDRLAWGERTKDVPIPDTVALAKLPCVQLIKESTRDLARVSRLIVEIDRAGHARYFTTMQMLLATLQLGGSGATMPPPGSEIARHVIDAFLCKRLRARGGNSASVRTISIEMDAPRACADHEGCDEFDRAACRRTLPALCPAQSR
jgi:hypothetical protein